MARAKSRSSHRGNSDEASIPVARPAPSDARQWPAWHEQAPMLVLIVAGVTLFAFAYLFTCEFCSWDDQTTIARTPLLTPPSLKNVVHMWDPRNPLMDLYVPVTYTVWSAMAAVSY